MSELSENLRRAAAELAAHDQANLMIEAAHRIEDLESVAELLKEHQRLSEKLDSLYAVMEQVVDSDFQSKAANGVLRSAVESWRTDGKRNCREWEVYFDAKVIDPDGWRTDATPLEAPITKEEFAQRWAASSCRQPPSDELRALVEECRS